MKAYKIEVLVIDHEDYGPMAIGLMMDNVKYLNTQLMSSKQVDIGEWSDDHPLNNRDTATAEYHRLFG